ncbi:MAG: hypothetical protein E7171_08495 [Firmicutes bacterium]|nr:hypothetical protein [Bacillota bacterium]
MKEKVVGKVDPAIKDLNMFVSDVYVSEEEGVTNLNVELDSSEVIDVERITEASKIINPIMDELDLLEGEYVLDIHSKVKGDVIDE